MSQITSLDGIIMSVKPTGIDFPNDSLEQADKSTLISIIETLAGELSSVKSEVSEVKSEVSSLREDSDRNSREIADTNGRVSEVEDDIEDIHENVDRASKKIADTNGRVSDLEDNTDASDASESDNSTKGKSGESTALEQVCALTDDESEKHLTANQKRARSIAKRVDEYSKSVQAGRAITSSRMRDILSGMEDKRVHRQTVQRVMDFLKRFGDGHIDTKETRGGKTVTVFSETVVENITSVVTGDESSAVTPPII